MFVSHIALDDFRSYRHAVLEFQPGTTVLLGANGQGKTNLVEALAYLSSFSSHRVAADTALVRAPMPGENPVPGAVVRAKSHSLGRERVIELEIIRGKANRGRVNRNSVRPRDLLGLVRTVVFAPEDMELVTGDPGARRRFLDDLAVQLWPAYSSYKSDYDKVARQRGALLKQLGKQKRRGQPVDPATLEVWNKPFIESASAVVKYRTQLVELLKDPAHKAHETVSEAARELYLSYESSLSAVDGVDGIEGYEDRLASALANVAKREIARGVNLVGPHRDDLQLHLDHLPVKGYASHGECWSVALALRLGAFEVLSKDRRTGEVDPPVLILDDVFSELDAARRSALLEVIERAEQTIITAAVGTDLPEQIQAHTVSVVWDKNQGTQLQTVDRVDTGPADNAGAHVDSVTHVDSGAHVDSADAGSGDRDE